MKNVIRVEAEELRLKGYFVEKVAGSGASGGKHISIKRDARKGSASGTFEGEAGKYDVSVGYYDENDGVSAAKVNIAGSKKPFLFNRNLPANGPKVRALTSRVTHRGVDLQPGARFTLDGAQNRGEFARFDYIQFKRVGAALPPILPKPQPTIPQREPVVVTPAVDVLKPNVLKPNESELSSGLGTNLAGIADWSTQYPFVDFFKNARQWVPVKNGQWYDGESSKLNLDDSGWVKSFSGGKISVDEVATLIPNPAKFDRYVVRYEGEGVVPNK